MTNKQQQQCLEALDTINLIRHYLEIASKLEKTDASYPHEFLLEEAARQLDKSQETLHDIVFDDQTDEDRENEQSLTPELKTKREEDRATQEKQMAALKAMSNLAFETPDFAIKLEEAIRKDLSKVEAFLAAEDETEPGESLPGKGEGATVDEAKEASAMPDFRTVQPDSPEENELQRTLEVMRYQGELGSFEADH